MALIGQKHRSCKRAMQCTSYFIASPLGSPQINFGLSIKQEPFQRIRQFPSEASINGCALKSRS